MPKLIKIVLTAAICILCTPQQASSQKKIRIAGLDSLYMPEISGTIRGKFEYQPQEGASRFQVRTARVSISGNVIPIISYKAEIDLCDEGKIKMLDAYARVKPLQDGQITIGQMRAPFTIDAHRSPHLQYFANRSFIAKQTGNIRDVGIMLGYKFNTKIPVSIDGGIFNGSGLTGQKDFWTKRVNYSIKAQFGLFDNFNLQLSTQSISPNKKPIYMHDFGANYQFGRFFAEAEFLYKHYADNAFQSVKAFDSFIVYTLPIERTLRNISFLARYDMMTDHSDGTVDEQDNLILTDSKRHRATAGITLSFGKKFQSDIRVNYEKYFYDEDATVKISEQDKLVVELMIHF